MTLGYSQVRLVTEIIERTFDAAKKEFSRDELLYVIGEMEHASKYLAERERTNRYRIFRMFVEYCLYRNLANYDTLIILTGQKGAGKSSFALMLAREWCKLLGIKFNSNIHFAYTNAQMTNAIEKLPKFSPLVGDEAVNFATSEGWALKANKELKKRLAQVRTKHFFFILCFPLKVYKVDKMYLDSFVNYWIDVFGRGRGALFVRDMNPVHDSWRLKSFMDIRAYNEFTPSKDVERALRKHPNFWHVMRAPKPPKRVYEKYLKTRERNVYNDATVMGTVDKNDIVRSLLLKTLEDVMARDRNVTVKRIALHIKTQYGTDVTAALINAVLQDSDLLFERAREEGIIGRK